MRRKRKRVMKGTQIMIISMKVKEMNTKKTSTRKKGQLKNQLKNLDLRQLGMKRKEVTTKERRGGLNLQEQENSITTTRM